MEQYNIVSTTNTTRETIEIVSTMSFKYGNFMNVCCFRISKTEEHQAYMSMNMELNDENR